MTEPTSSYIKKLKDGAVNQVDNDLIIAKGMVWYGSDGATREGLSWWLKDQWSNKIMFFVAFFSRFFDIFFPLEKYKTLRRHDFESMQKRLQENKKMIFITSHSVMLHLSPPDVFWEDCIIGFVKGIAFIPYLMPSKFLTMKDSKEFLTGIRPLTCCTLALCSCSEMTASLDLWKGSRLYPIWCPQNS